jgi:hypothetical protein
VPLSSAERSRRYRLRKKGVTVDTVTHRTLRPVTRHVASRDESPSENVTSPSRVTTRPVTKSGFRLDPWVKGNPQIREVRTQILSPEFLTDNPWKCEKCDFRGPDSDTVERHERATHPTVLDRIQEGVERVTDTYLKHPARESPEPPPKDDLADLPPYHPPPSPPAEIGEEGEEGTDEEEGEVGEEGEEGTE